MAKTYSKQTIIGDAGVALIHRRINEMGFAWHARSGLDVGVDGTVELRDPTTGEALNRFLLVQSKASEGRFPGENDDRFHYVCDPEDIDYWLKADLPVLLVCSHPRSQDAWWVNITEWFSETSRRIERRVEFDKHRDRFDATAATSLLAVGAADLSSPLTPSPGGETLVSNLLPVLTTPPSLYLAPAAVQTVQQAVHRLRANRRQGGDWLLLDRNIYSFTDLSGPPFDVLCEPAVERIATEEWLSAEDHDTLYRLTRLLNQLLQNIHHRDLRWHAKHRFLYFKPNEDLSDRKATSGRGSGRTVVRAYRHRDDSTRVNHYRHYAVSTRFVRLPAGWHLAINPDYHFTRDGYRDSAWADQQRSGIKRIERNGSVLALLRFWEHFLTVTETLLDKPDARLQLGPLVKVEADAGFLETKRQRRTADEDNATGALFRLP